MTIQTSRVANPELLVLLVLRDDAADAVDEHHLVVRDESHELVFAVAIEQHQYPYLVLAHLRRRDVHTAALHHRHHHHTSIYSAPITIIGHRCITESSELSANTERQTKKSLS